MGAVSTTFMAGVELVRKGKSQPVDRSRRWAPFAGQAYGRAFAAHQGIRPFGRLSDLAFGGWDIFKDNAYQSAANAGVLNPQDLAKVKTHFFPASNR